MRGLARQLSLILSSGGICLHPHTYKRQEYRMHSQSFCVACILNMSRNRYNLESLERGGQGDGSKNTRSTSQPEFVNRGVNICGI